MAAMTSGVPLFPSTTVTASPGKTLQHRKIRTDTTHRVTKPAPIRLARNNRTGYRRFFFADTGSVGSNVVDAAGIVGAPIR